MQSWVKGQGTYAKRRVSDAGVSIYIRARALRGSGRRGRG